MDYLLFFGGTIFVLFGIIFPSWLSKNYKNFIQVTAYNLLFNPALFYAINTFDDHSSLQKRISTCWSTKTISPAVTPINWPCTSIFLCTKITHHVVKL